MGAIIFLKSREWEIQMVRYYAVCFTDKGEKIYDDVAYESQNKAMERAEIMMDELTDVVVLMYGAEPVKG